MTEGTELPQEVKEVPQETKEVAEARQELDRATIEPEAAVEKAVDIKTSEAVEAAVKEAVDAAVPAADGGRGTEDRAVESKAPAKRAGETPPPPEAPDPVSPMFPASAHGDSGISESSIDTAKTPVDEAESDRSSVSQVQEVSSAARSTSGEDFSVEMEGAKPGELRGFDTESKTFELKTDGQTDTQTVQEQIESLETAQETPPVSAESVTLEPVGETASPVEEASAESGEVQRGDELEEVAAPTLGAESSAEEISPEAARAVSGGASPPASGLPVDDAQEGSTQDTALGGTTGESRAAPLETAPSSSAAASELDPESLVQEAIRESYLESEQDLTDYADKVHFFNTQKESVRSYAEDLRDANLPETSPESLAEGLSRELAGSGTISIIEPAAAEPVDQAALRDQLLGGSGSSSQDGDSTAPEASGLPMDEGSRDATENKLDSQAEFTAGSEEDGVWETVADGNTTSSTVNEIIENMETAGEQFQPPDTEAGEASDAASDQPEPPQREDYDSDEAYNAAMKKYNASLEEADAQTEAIDEQLAAILESIRLSINALMAKGQELKQAREKLNDIQSTIQELSAEIVLVVDLIREVREENSLLADHLADLEAGETISITFHTGADPTSRPASGDYSWTEETQEMDREMIENRISTNEDLISSLEGRIIALQEEINIQTSNLENKQSDIEKLLKDIQDLTDNIQALQQQAAALAETLGKSYTPSKIPIFDTITNSDVSPSTSRQVTGSGGPPPAAGGLPLDD